MSAHTKARSAIIARNVPAETHPAAREEVLRSHWSKGFADRLMEAVRSAVHSGIAGHLAAGRMVSAIKDEKKTAQEPIAAPER